MSGYVTIPNLGQPLDHLPGARVVNGAQQIQLPVDAAAVLTMRMGQPCGAVMPPVLGPLALDGLHTDPRLRPYQREGVVRIIACLRRDQGHILADDMGLGKTLQTCAVWDGMRRPHPLLVVAPASTRRGWVKEFKRWLGLDVTLVETGKQASAVPNQGVVITSYELVGKLPSTFAPHMVVLDEAHLLRGRRAKRSEVLLERAQLATYRLALTGTPMWGRPRDLWMLLKILFKWRFGTAEQFDYAYCNASINKWGGRENKGVSRSDELRLRLSYVMTRRTKKELGDQLPSLTRVIRWLPAEKNASRLLQAFALGQVHLSDALAATLQSKLQPVVDAVEELEGHAIVFTWMKDHAAALVNLIAEAGYPVRLITGDMTHKQRQIAVEQATSGKECVVATIDSTGTGVDGLQHVADTVLFHALDYTPIKMAQAESRAHRLGQTKPVTAVYFAMEDSADRLVVEKVVDKLDAWRQTMGSDSTGEMHDVMASPATAEAEARALKEIYESLQLSDEEE